MNKLRNEMLIFDRAKYKDWVDWEKQTAEYVQTFWNASNEKQKQDPKFLVFLVQCGWINKSEDIEESTRIWRNRNLAKMLEIKHDEDALLEVIRKNWPQIDNKTAGKLVSSGTGITHYYKPQRPSAIQYILENHHNIFKAFEAVSSKNMDVEQKIKLVFKAIGDDQYFKTPSGGSSSIINAISPTLACLDPSNEFPIMNQKTLKLLQAIGKKQDAEGAIALTGLISNKYNIKNAFELDVYSQTGKFSMKQRSKSYKPDKKTVGLRARSIRIRTEENGYYSLSKQRRVITKVHNKLVNAFFKRYQWDYKIHEGVYDLLLSDYKKGRRLLIEVKTASSDEAGRNQVRQAVGQLFDYRRTHFLGEIDKIDLALLLPDKPKQDIIDLLQSLDIHVLWFDGDNVKGTIEI